MPAGTGTPEGTRTPDLLLRRQLLYPAELLALIAGALGALSLFRAGAGDGNRTHTTSLEGWDSAIELHPHFATAIIIAQRPFSVNKISAFFCRETVELQYILDREEKSNKKVEGQSHYRV